MATSDEAQCLDDLRKRRLAYFTTLNKAEAASVGSLQDDRTSRTEELCDKKYIYNVNSTSEITTKPENDSESVKEYREASGDHIKASVLVGNKHSEINGKENGKENQKKIELGSLHQCDQELNSYSPKMDSESNSRHFLSSTKTFSLDKPGKSDGLEAYNETVERLIKATKEELLGMKPDDDIWTKIKHETFQCTKSEKNNVNGIVTSASIVDSGPLGFPQSSHSHSSQTSEFKTIDIGKETTKSHFIIGPADALKQDKTFYEEYKPDLSECEPQKHVSDKEVDNLQKSFTSAKVEEIFSSRQFVRPPPTQLVVKDSQELGFIKETEPLKQSKDLNELGLSTHRPDSERNGTVADAEDLNLGDTVTKELRLVLGEEKFREFIQKAKRDIDDLHERSSESSARRDKTPRLIKDSGNSKPVYKCQTESKHERKNVLKSKEKDLKVSEDIDMEKKHAAASRHCNEFLPKQPDADAVENMIGEYVLRKPNQVCTENIQKEDCQNREMTEGAESDKIVPSLDLNEVNKPFRPKLNRPKYEPPTIYQESKVKVEQEALVVERKGSGDTRLRQSNYEQVTVPRNVAFSADEIYNQAYGFIPTSQSAITSQHYLHGHPTHMPYGIPQTPTTPVSQQQLFQAYIHNSNSEFSALNSEGLNSYRQFPGRQLSHSGEGSLKPFPPEQVIQSKGFSQSQSFSMADFQVMNGSPVRYSMAGGPVHIPHPPSAPTSVPQSPESFHPSFPAAFSRTHSFPDGVPQHFQPLVPVPHPPAVSESVELRFNFPSSPQVLATPLAAKVPVSMAAQTKCEPDVQSSPLPTPTTSNAEVQTDREDFTEVTDINNDKGNTS